MVFAHPLCHHLATIEMETLQFQCQQQTILEGELTAQFPLVKLLFRLLLSHLMTLDLYIGLNHKTREHKVHVDLYLLRLNQIMFLKRLKYIMLHDHSKVKNLFVSTRILQILQINMLM